MEITADVGGRTFNLGVAAGSHVFLLGAEGAEAFLAWEDVPEPLRELAVRLEGELEEHLKRAEEELTAGLRRAVQEMELTERLSNPLSVVEMEGAIRPGEGAEISA